ncbi:putative NADPH-quinone reductase (modulator of drug activity B) [Xenococcus sp. PCC 7305]|uniref:NAD(P)H-dependent oxidoreductase n=1 Tax=Xenococcus sp. PCC 7305 TaxID=102125 RepID=UPI0002ABCD27|nr:NAD(P)H-dependent oxidoreductase [Xenococcus sp. PCC 7305]ELS04871.1 putative NADPH-quinone reductase (modulator of drug activity B) [Xenococcus sp. PCC 7305]
MKNIFLINAHEPYPFSEGKLNQSLTKKAVEILEHKGYSLRTTAITEAYTVEDELAKHQWADAIILQSPVNWMGVPWSFKKYMDQVYTAGMKGQLCDGDGRSRQDASKQYGSGGTLKNKKYMFSLTFNAPQEAFDNQDQFLFAGKSVDDLFFPMHMNFRFFGMEALETFVCFDVLKNPDIERDFERFETHLNMLF